MILIPTKSVTFAHSGLVFMDKSSTDGEEQLPSSLTRGQPNLQQAALQLYRRPTYSAGSSPTQQQNTPTKQQSTPTPQQSNPNTAANHPNPAAEATDAAGPIIRDYGITN